MKEAASANLQFYTAVELSVVFPLLLFSFVRKTGSAGLQGGNEIVEERRRGNKIVKKRRGEEMSDNISEKEEGVGWERGWGGGGEKQ